MWNLCRLMNEFEQKYYKLENKLLCNVLNIGRHKYLKAVALKCGLIVWIL